MTLHVPFSKRGLSNGYICTHYTLFQFAQSHRVHQTIIYLKTYFILLSVETPIIKLCTILPDSSTEHIYQEQMLFNEPDPHIRTCKFELINGTHTKGLQVGTCTLACVVKMDHFNGIVKQSRRYCNSSIKFLYGLVLCSLYYDCPSF